VTGFGSSALLLVAVRLTLALALAAVDQPVSLKVVGETKGMSWRLFACSSSSPSRRLSSFCSNCWRSSSAHRRDCGGCPLSEILTLFRFVGQSIVSFLSLVFIATLFALSTHADGAGAERCGIDNAPARRCVARKIPPRLFGDHGMAPSLAFLAGGRVLAHRFISASGSIATPPDHPRPEHQMIGERTLFGGEGRDFLVEGLAEYSAGTTSALGVTEQARLPLVKPRFM